MMRLFAFPLLAVLLLAAPVFAQITIKETKGGLEVQASGKPFTTYLFQAGAKPVLWPVVGPTGKEMTRAWPLREGNPDEKTDHVHQKSFWFTHGEVNGISFWDENPKHGWIDHQAVVKAEGGKEGVIVTTNLWLNNDRSLKVCSDERTLRFGASDDARWIDFTAVVKADQGKDVTFGDTKEGAFGVRIAESMRTDRKLGGKIITSEGLTDADAWGKPAAWVDYYGPVEGEQLGIAILNHPSSFRFPTTWHVRTYGLFAANPFGLGDFTGKKKEGVTGEHIIKAGQSMTLKYRVLFHKGDEKAGKVAAAFADFSKE